MNAHPRYSVRSICQRNTQTATNLEMRSNIVLYSSKYCAAVRTVITVAKLLDLELEIREVDFTKREQFNDSYVKVNPEHTLPTLVDADGFVIWESHAICAYLVDKYAKDDSLYPKDLQSRARCNQRMIFNATKLYVPLRQCCIQVNFRGAKEIPQDSVEQIYVACDFMEKFLESDPFLVGKKLTIADIGTAVTMSSIEVFAPLSSGKYPNICDWLQRINQSIPFFGQLNSDNVKIFQNLINENLEKNRSN